MKDLVELIAKSLVDNPDSVVVKETTDDNTINIELTVAPEDMGKVIGKGGRIERRQKGYCRYQIIISRG